MKEDNSTAWKKSRKTYVEYRNGRRNLKKALQKHDRTYNRLENAFEKFISVQAFALNHLEDATQGDEMRKAFKAFQSAKSDHDLSRAQLRDAFREFQRLEIRYGVRIFKGLISRHKLKVSDLTRIYGLYSGNINDWIRAENEQELIDIHNKELGV